VRRTAAAAALVGLSLTAVIGGWLVTGWRAASSEARALAEAPRSAAAERAALLAAELGARLEELRAAESARPYYEYQNLYHDPRGASEGKSVAPSPLSRGPQDPLVAVHFQIDPAGQLSAPTVNEELPHLSAQGRAAVDRRALAALGGALDELRLAALADAPADATAGEPGRSATARGIRRGARAQVQGPEPVQAQVQVQAVRPDAYAQNAMPNEVYMNLQGEGARATKAAAPAVAAEVIEIRVAALSWRTVVLDGTERLLALRTVETPDGRLIQGLALSPDALGAWLAERSPDLPARIAPGSPAGAPPSAPLFAGASAWHVQTDPAGALAAGSARGAQVRRGFLLQFAPAALLALLCGGLVVVLVARAERLARQRSDFAAAAAHELRTPLAGLVLYGDMLADGLGDPDRRADYARRVSEEAARLGRVVGNVLGFTQLERRQLAVSPRPGDAAAAARGAAERAAAALAHAGATLQTDLPEAAAARLDQDAVARILQNLLDNAEKYTRGASDRTILLAVRPDAAGGACIDVSDRGPGIPHPLRRRLFAPFSRGAAPDGPAGLGLGLALASALASAMGGSLGHRDREGGGAVFTLRLPPA
jgi:signal transduction histidine kinase